MRRSAFRYAMRRTRREFYRNYNKSYNSNVTYSNNIANKEISSVDVIIGLYTFIGIMIFISWLMSN